MAYRRPIVRPQDVPKVLDQLRAFADPSRTSTIDIMSGILRGIDLGEVAQDQIPRRS